MKKEEFEKLLLNDNYIKKRKDPSKSEIQLYLREVNFICPLCGDDLRNSKQKKNNALYEIAHIYPNRPTQEQYKALSNLKRLGENSESFENKIALCLKCHKTQDYHTSKDEYLKLVNIKEKLLKRIETYNATLNLALEDNIAIVVDKISKLKEEDFIQLNYNPVSLKNKFSNNEKLLKTKVSMYVTEYYPYILDLFKNLEGKNGFHLDVLSGQIKTCFIKMEYENNNKQEIFNQMVNWVNNKTLDISKEACEVVISFFIQNCEVFREITE